MNNIKAFKNWLRIALSTGLIGVFGAMGTVSLHGKDWNGGEGNWSDWTDWSNSSNENVNIKSGPLTLDTAVIAKNVYLDNNTTLKIENDLTARFLSLSSSATPSASISDGCTVDLTFCHIAKGSSLTSCPVLTITGGTTTIDSGKEGRQDALVLGYGGGTYGKLVMSGGTLTTSARGMFSLGNDANAYGQVDCTGGTINALSTLQIAVSGTGIFNLSQSSATVPTKLSVATLTLGSKAGGVGTLNIAGGEAIVSSSISVGVAGTGTVAVSGGTFETNSTLNVGTQATGKGFVNVSSGTLNAKAGMSLGTTAGASGSVSLTGGAVSVTGNLQVGNGGTGSVSVANSGVLTAGSLVVGNTSAGTLQLLGGTVNLTSDRTIFGFKGNGTLIVSGGTLNAGGQQISFAKEDSASTATNNTFTVSGGEIKAARIHVGDNSASTSTMTMTGGSINCTANFMLGRYGKTTAAQSAGSITANNLFVLGSFGGSEGSLTISNTGTAKGTTWYVGNYGTGTLTLENVTSANTVQNISGTNMFVGYEAGSLGTVNVKSGVMKVTNIVLGNSAGAGGTGTAKGFLNVSGGVVTATSTNLADKVTANGGAFGSLSVSGGTFTTATLNAANQSANTAEIIVSGTGKLLVTSSANIGKSGSVSTTISESGEFIAQNGTNLLNISFGNAAASTKNLFTMTGGKLTGQDIAFGTVAGSLVTMNVSGGEISGKNVFIGTYGQSNLTMTGGTIKVGTEFIVGRYGKSEVSVSGGKIEANQAILGSMSNSDGTMNFSGGSFIVTGGLFVGNNARGVLNLSGSAELQASDLVLRNHGTGVSTVNLEGGDVSVTLSKIRCSTESASPASLNFTLTETGLSTIAASAVNLGTGITISVNDSFAGFINHAGSYTLIDADALALNGVSLVSNSSIFKAPAIYGNDLIVELNPLTAAMTGETGHFQVVSLGVGDVEQLFFTTTLSDPTELTDFAQWLENETGVETQVENGGIYLFKAMDAADNFIWDFSNYGIGQNVAITRVGIDSKFDATPEPAAWLLAFLAFPALYFVRRRR